MRWLDSITDSVDMNFNTVATTGDSGGQRSLAAVNVRGHRVRHFVSHLCLTLNNNND